MSTLFMRIRGIDDVKGASQVAGDAILTNGGSTVVIDGMKWGVTRDVKMDVGNGNNSDTGLLSVGSVEITKAVDGISPSIMTLLFKPVKNRVVDIVYGIPDATGKGVRQQFTFTLDGARVVSYEVTTKTDDNGSKPAEKVVLSCTEIVTKFNPTGINGAFGDATADMVDYNISTNTLLAGTDMK